MSEIGLARAQAVQFEISDFDFEMQDSSNFKISSLGPLHDSTGLSINSHFPRYTVRSVPFARYAGIPPRKPNTPE